MKTTDLFGPGITCRVCKKNEVDLEKVGISMNIPMETCNECLRRIQNLKTVLPKDTKKRKYRNPSHARAYHLLMEILLEHDDVMGEIRQGSHQTEALLDYDSRMYGEAFFDLLKRADKIIDWSDEDDV